MFDVWWTRFVWNNLPIFGPLCRRGEGAGGRKPLGIWGASEPRTCKTTWQMGHQEPTFLNSWLGTLVFDDSKAGRQLTRSSNTWTDWVRGDAKVKQCLPATFGDRNRLRLRVVRLTLWMFVPRSWSWPHDIKHQSELPSWLVALGSSLIFFTTFEILDTFYIILHIWRSALRIIICDHIGGWARPIHAWNVQGWLNPKSGLGCFADTV